MFVPNPGCMLPDYMLLKKLLKTPSACHTLDITNQNQNLGVMLWFMKKKIKILGNSLFSLGF